MERSIRVRNLNKKINGKEILKNINFDVYEGEIIGLVGKNGAGKSTLLKVMTGLYSMDSGDIYYYDYNLNNEFEKAMSIVGTLIETPELYKELGGGKNLEIFRSMFRNVTDDSINEILKMVEMENAVGKKFKTYSLGMKERLGIAQALINKPKILILDEPTNGLDPVGVKKIFEIIKSMKDVSIIISSHMLSEIEGICDKVIFINNGEIKDIKQIDKNVKKRKVLFEVNDFIKARALLGNYCVSENLEVYETDRVISRLNKELIFNNIDVYRIREKEHEIEDEFFDMVNSND